MIQSMTGFASKTFMLYVGNSAKSSVSMHLKTLNSRFFETNFKLPHIFTHIETHLTKLFKARLARGYVHFTIQMSNPGIFKGAIEPVMPVVDGYVDAIKVIQKRHGIKQEIALDHLLNLSNVFAMEESPVDEESTRKVLDAVSEMLEGVIKERLREGQALLIDLQQRFAALRLEITTIEQRASEHISERQKKVYDIAQQAGLDDSSLAEMRKMALYATLDKIDIHEEIVRFKSHLDNMTENLASADAEKGKRLDFILQELAREMNTISAKCSDSIIGSHAINAKVEIEKAREQVQNIV